MVTALSIAVAYIHENGAELERARLTGVLGRSRVEPKAARSLLARQNEDGGFPFGLIPGRPSAVTATTTALQWMQDLRLLPSSFVERATAYLLTVQRPEGAWDESPGVLRYDPPVWARPGSVLARACCTALTVSWMVRLLGRRYDAVTRAAAFLRTSRNDSWPSDEPPQITAHVAAALLMVDGLSSPVASVGLGVLRGLAPHAWTADCVTDALTAFHLAGLPADDPLIASGLRRLLMLQRSDGGWSSEYGADQDVDLSLRALSVLLAHGVSVSPTPQT
jgi:hypothetical protein